jgi:hypothetical protein
VTHDPSAHVIVAPHQLCAVSRPERTEEFGRARGIGLRLQGLRLQIQPKRSDELRLRRIDGVHFDNDLCARACCVRTVVIEQPVPLPLVLKKEIPVCWKEVVVRDHVSRGRTVEAHDARAFAVSLGSDPPRPLAQPVETFLEDATEPAVLREKRFGLSVMGRALARRKRESGDDVLTLTIDLRRPALVALCTTEKEGELVRPIESGLDAYTVSAWFGVET